MTSGPLSVPEFPNLNTKEAPDLSEDVKTQLGIHARAINSMSISSGGSPGTVTSVGLAVPAEFSVSGSPVTTAGTITIGKANETANTVWAGPTSGGAAAPTFRALVAADVPAPALTATEIGYGSAGNTLTGDATLTWDTTNKIITESGAATGGATLSRLMTETTDSTSMTEVKQQPFHLWQITNKVKTPGAVGAISITPNGASGVSGANGTASTGLTGMTSVSLSGWMYVTSYGAVGSSNHFMGGYIGSGSGNYSVILQTVDGGGQGIEWNVKSTNGTSRLLFENPSPGAGINTPLSVNTWHHVVVTWNGTTQKFYVDGTDVTSLCTVIDSAATGGTINISGTGKFAVGSTTLTGSSTMRIDEVQVYKNYTLTGSDVTTLYNGGAGTATAVTPGGGGSLGGQWHFDDASGPWTDSSGGSHSLANFSSGTGTNPTATTGLIVAAPALTARNVIKSQDGSANGETQILTIGDTGDTVNIVGTLQNNGSTAIGAHPLLDGSVNNDTLAGSVARGDVIVGNSTPKWARVAKGTSGQVLRSDGTDVAYAAIDASSVTAGLTDLTNGDVTTSRHGFAPKSPNDATKYLDGTGTYSIPAGGSTVVTSNPGAMTRIAQLFGDGSTATIDFQNIPSYYDSLYITVDARDTKAATQQLVSIKFNNDGTSGNYVGGQFILGAASAASAGSLGTGATGISSLAIPAGNSTAGLSAHGEITISNYAGTSFWKRADLMTGRTTGGGPTEGIVGATGYWKSTAAVTRLTFTTDGTAFTTASVITLYGIGSGGRGTLFTATADKTVASSVAETSIIGTGVGAATLGNGFLTVGRTINVRTEGIISDTGTPTIQFKGKLGSVVLVDMTAITLPSSISAVGFIYEWQGTCRTTGASGTVFGQGQLTIYGTAGSPVSYRSANSVTSTVDTTASSTLVDSTITWGTSSSSNTITGQMTTITAMN